MNIVESLFRWTHVVSGILWIGLLYFFNWVNSAFVPTLDADAKRKVVPELMPRALYWFRWGAAWTWITGVLLLLIVYYTGGILFEDPTIGWHAGAIICLVVVVLSVFVYDVLYKTVFTDPKIGFIAGLALTTALVALFEYLGRFSYRGTSIHLAGTFGTIMAFNVWYRIWPSQRQIITATKNGVAPDAALVKLAGTRSKHNTYMSVPLVFGMISQHATWAAGRELIALPLVVLFAWSVVWMLYKRAGKVKGF